MYQISYYSENMFLFFSLAGLYIIYYKQKEDSNSKFYLPSTTFIVGATFVFGMATCTRSTGVLMSVFVAFFMLKKMLDKIDSCCKLFKYILFSWFCAVIIFLPLWVIMFWKPYLLHCETKLERSDEISAWCLEPFSNVYNHIQYIYWDNQFLGIF